MILLIYKTSSKPRLHNGFAVDCTKNEFLLLQFLFLVPSVFDEVLFLICHFIQLNPDLAPLKGPVA